jgi:hypothetical protein
MIRNGFESIFLTRAFPLTDSISAGRFNAEVADSALGWLHDYRMRLSASREKLAREKDAMIEEMRARAGGTEELIRQQRMYYNDKLGELVLNRIDLHKIIQVDGKLIRKMEPVYQYPVSRNGRAHFFASEKRLGNGHLPTLLFNVLALWLMTLGFYFTLQFSLLARSLKWAREIRRRNRQG